MIKGRVILLNLKVVFSGPGSAQLNASTSLTDSQYIDIINLLERQTGCIFGSQEKWIIEKALAFRMHVLSQKTNKTIQSFAYIEYLKKPNIEKVNFINEVVKLYSEKLSLFSQLPQLLSLGMLIKQKINPVGVQKENPLLIWNAGCLTGEDAVSLAMILSDLKQFSLEIIGSSVFAWAIERASLGNYSASKATTVPEKYLSLLNRNEDSSVNLIDAMRKTISFVYEHPAFVKKKPQPQVIIARNFPISVSFFSNLARQLLLGGYLVLHSQTKIVSFSDITFKKVGPDIYQRVA